MTEYVDQSFDSKLALVKRTLAYDLEKSEVQMKKLLKYLTDPVDLHPLTVRGINKPELFLMTVRQRTLPKLFYTTMEMVEQKLIEERRRGRLIYSSLFYCSFFMILKNRLIYRFNF